MAIIVVELVSYLVYAPIDTGDKEPIEVLIENGQGVNNIASILSERDLIRSQIVFVGYVRLVGEEKNLKAGRYIFFRSLNIPAIISMLANGSSESDDITITIPEGSNIWEIDNILQKVIGGKFASRFYQEEGYLFPDTYRLQSQNVKIKNQNLIEELREKMRMNFLDKTDALFKNLSFEKQAEIIVVASILEKEAKSEEDMKLIAGIIEKRLKMDIPLQIDATVVYGACKREYVESNFTKNCDVTFQGPAIEIKIDGPYNTYTRKGLPVGPISNPGLKAINSALNPQTSDYLYYLSTRDGSQMIYSKTAGEHGGNRKKYLGI